MKNIQSYLVLITGIFTLLFTAVLLNPAIINAQTSQLFVVTPIQQDQNLDFFFTHSIHPLAYYESTTVRTVKTPVFLSIITPQQKEDYVKAGYKPTIVDNNAGQIGDHGQYYVLFSSQPNQSNILNDPAYKKQGLELVYPVTEYITLIKLVPSVTFNDLKIPGKSAFSGKRFSKNLVPPTDRTTAEIRQALLQPRQKTTSRGIPNPFPMFFSIVIPLFTVYLIYRPKKKKY